jgi:hypothetical protein
MRRVEEELPSLEKGLRFLRKVNQSFNLGDSPRYPSEGAPAMEESVFPYPRSQSLQSRGLHQDDASLFTSTHFETVTCPGFLRMSVCLAIQVVYRGHRLFPAIGK